MIPDRRRGGMNCFRFDQSRGRFGLVCYVHTGLNTKIFEPTNVSKPAFCMKHLKLKNNSETSFPNLTTYGRKMVFGTEGSLDACYLEI